MTGLLPKGSMQRRLVIQLSLIALLLSLVLFLIVRGMAERAAADTQDNILAASATSIADALFVEGGQVRLELPYSALSMLGTISEDRVFYRVLVDGETLTGYDDLVVKAALAVPNQPEFSTFEYRGEQVRAVVVTRLVGSQSQQALVRTVVAQTRLGLVQISSRITLWAVAIGIVFFFVAAGLEPMGRPQRTCPAQSCGRFCDPPRTQRSTRGSNTGTGGIGAVNHRVKFVDRAAEIQPYPI